LLLVAVRLVLLVVLRQWGHREEVQKQKRLQLQKLCLSQ